jgi:hypothetical protein
MTVKVAGHWEREWQCPLREFDLWVHPLKEFGIDSFYMCPITGISPKACMERQTIEEVMEENPKLTIVFVDEEGESELKDFVHPEDALYVFGKTRYSPYKIHKGKENIKSVKIESVRNSGGFWGHQTAAMVLYDRFIKENK